MPRLTRSLPKYRRHKASGQAVVTLGGRDFYLGPHGSKASTREYDRLVAEWLTRGRICAEADHLVTVAVVMAAYWRHARSYYCRNGVPTGELPAIKSALRFIEALYRSQSAVNFGPIALKAVRQTMIEAGLSRGTVNQHVGRIKRMFRWAASEQLIPGDIVTQLATVHGLRRGRTDARETSRVLPIDDQTITLTLKHLPEVVADLIQVQRLTAMRPAEVCLLRPCDVDRSGEVWTYRPESHKTEHHGRDRVVCLGPKAQAILLKYLVRDAADYCFRPRDSEAKRLAELHCSRETPLSCGNRPGTNRKRNPKRRAGERYTVDSYRRAIHRACDKAKVERWSPNRLRHTAATEFRAKFGLEAAQVLLGHAGADVTQVYAERDLAKGFAVAKEIG